MKELKKLISQGESEKLEFKKSAADWKAIIETVAAFSNSRGGKIIIGVADSLKSAGIKVGKNTVENLTNQILQNTDPKVHPRITIKKINSESVIIIEVKESPDHLVLAFGRPFKRVGKSTVKMSKDEYEAMILEKHKNKLYFDSQICKEADLNDIDREKVKWYIQRKEEKREVKKPKKMEIETLLLNAGAAKNTGKKIMPTNAGILFFAKNPQRFILQSQLRIAIFAGKTFTRDFLDKLDCSGSLWEIIENAEKFVRKNSRIFGFRTEFDFKRIDKLEYPLKAIREAIINAVTHRDYRKSADTRVLIFNDRIEIVNSGSFPKGVTPQNPRHVPVNPTLCQLMYDVGFIEKYGTGIYMMKETCEEYGIPEPEYEMSEVETKLTFYSGGKSIIISEIEKLGIGLKEREKKALMYAFEKGFITNKIYTDINKVSSKTASLELKNIGEKRLLEVQGKGRSTKYVPMIR